MNTEQRCASYIESLYTDIPEYLDELAVSARENEVPIIRPAMMNYMQTMLSITKPATILEIGTAVGFSALFMKEYAPKGCKITTIENYEPRIVQAKENFAKFDLENQITLIEGDATKIIKDLSGNYDIIFMDAAKGQYINMYDDIKRLIHGGGIILSDNVLQEGDIYESRYALTRRDRTIHSRMREYLYRLTHDEDFTTSILPIADGVAVSVKK